MLRKEYVTLLSAVIAIWQILQSKSGGTLIPDIQLVSSKIFST